MFRRPIVLAALVAIGLLGTTARADLIVTVQEDAGPTQTFTVLGAPTTDPTFAGTTVTTPDYTIKVLGGEAFQDSISELLSSTTSVTRALNTGGNSGTHVLHITITGTGYTAPNTPPNISALSHIGFTVAKLTTPSTNSLSFTSVVAPAVFAPPGPFTPQTPNITSIGSGSDDQARTITTLVGTFTISQTLNIQLNKLGDQINYSSSTTLASIAVPEPSSMALAGLGGLGLVGYGLRRRKALSV